MNNHALLIGVGQRSDDKPTIAVTATDAARLATELEKRCRYPANQIHSLTGESASKTNILEKLMELAEKTQAKTADLVVIFYSGHAVVKDGQFYLVSRDTRNKLLEDTALNGKRFLELIQRIQSKAVLLLLNCCHAGAVGENIDIPFDKSAFISQSNRAILTACTKSEVAFVSTPLSVFTYSVLSGLAGECIRQEKKDKVTLFDLAMYVRENVAAVSKGKQHPELSVLKEEATTNFEIVDYSNGIPTFTKEARGGLYDALGKSLELAERIGNDSDYRKQYEWLGNLKNVAINSNLKAKGNITFGDTNNQETSEKPKNDKTTIENTAINSQIEANGDIRFGNNGSNSPVTGIKNTALDSQISAGGNITFGDTISNHYTMVQPSKVTVSPNTFKAELQKLMGSGKTDKVLERFLVVAKENLLDDEDELIMLSARYANLSKEIRQGVLSKSEERLEHNQIIAALTKLVNNLDM